MKFKLNELNWPTLILILVVVVAAIFAAIKGFSAMKDLFTKTDDERLNDQIEKEVTGINTQTLTSMQIQQSAEQLHSAMAKAGTDEDTIIRIFTQLNTLGDLYAIIRAFGKRPYWFDGSGGVISGFFADDLNLVQWIQKDAENLIPEINSIFVSKAINFQM